MKMTNIKHILTYIFLTVSCVIALFVGIFVTKALFFKNDINKTGQTNTFFRANKKGVDISIKKNDFYTDNSNMVIINISNDKFVIIYNRNQIKMFTRNEFGDFSDKILSQRLTSFAKLLWKYIDLSNLMKLEPLVIEKTMGKLIANNQDYTNDMVTYTNFCLGFVATDASKSNSK
ncbi:hypothetical protein M153_17266000124 [Pseudoloma neurophilia]|uniref:Uncharacterized protein n=1 Tax=Pseudoloma neurophilia TaxID=146866 RepID=A0A0R0LR48_9MICR|nr:hypothetical protein M153_17266000124 [Pseudoloma neurophilia]